MTRRLLRSQRGTSMIEFALVLPVFVFMLVGVIEMGRYTYFAVLAQHAARAGVQYAAQNLQTAADASTSGPATANAAKQDGQSYSQWKVTSWISCTNAGAGTACPATNNAGTVSPGLVYYVGVKVTGTFKSLLSYPGIPNNVPISATAIMRVGNQ
jgi:Flp pilus assembly protein TadG